MCVPWTQVLSCESSAPEALASAAEPAALTARSIFICTPKCFTCSAWLIMFSRLARAVIASDTYTRKATKRCVVTHRLGLGYEAVDGGRNRARRQNHVLNEREGHGEVTQTLAEFDFTCPTSLASSYWH